MSEEGQQLRVEGGRAYLSRIPSEEKESRRLRLGRSVRGLATGSFKAARRGLEGVSTRSIGLTPSEYGSLIRLRELKRARGLSSKDTYIQEIKTLNELEARYAATTSRRKSQIRGAYRRLREGPPKRLGA